MRNKLLFLAGLGIGYVLGARAGRERYEELARAARKVKENPTFQETAGLVQAQTGAIVNSVKEVISDKAGHTKLGARITDMLSGQNAPDTSADREIPSNVETAQPLAAQKPTAAMR